MTLRRARWLGIAGLLFTVAVQADEPVYADVNEGDVLSAPEPSPPRLPQAVRDGAAGQTLVGDYRVYLEPDGKIARVEVLRSIAGYDATMIASFAHWPIVAPRRRVRFTTHLSLALASAAWTPPAPQMYDQNPISGSYPRLPDWAKRKYLNQMIDGVYVVTIQRDGSVEKVDVRKSIPGVDAGVIDTIMKWRYRTQTLPTRALFRFSFKVVP